MMPFEKVFRLAKFVIVGVFYLSFPRAAEAATYYVSPTGSDLNSCTAAQNIHTPKATIGGGISCLAGGETLLIRAGTYNEALFWGGPSGTPPSGSDRAYTRLAAYNGEIVILRPDTPASGQVLDFRHSEHHIEFDGINFDASLAGPPGKPYGGGGLAGGGVKVEEYVGESQAHHIRIKNFDLYGYSSIAVLLAGNYPNAIGSNEILNGTIRSSEHTIVGTLPGEGLYIQSNNNVVDNVNVYDGEGGGFQIYNGYGYRPTGNIIRNSKFHDDLTYSGDGTRFWGGMVGGVNTQFYNNVIYNIGGSAGSGSAGITCWAASQAVIVNNTVYNAPYGIYLTSTCSSTTVKNNIAYGSRFADYVDGGAATTASNNLFGVSPGFVSAARANFQLQLGSPAIDAAVSVSGLTSDILGTPRPQGKAPDIGAFEFEFSLHASPAAVSHLRILSN
jgi:parallel beta-helix repeat protein